VRGVTVGVSLVEMGLNSFHFSRKQKCELVMIKPPMAEIDRIRPEFALRVREAVFNFLCE
jgi:hypothetical protein